LDIDVSEVRAMAPLWRIRRGLIGLIDFKGRATRSDFLFGLIVLMLVGFTLDWIIGKFLEDPRNPFESLGSFAIFMLASTILARRLHDQNRSGWSAVIVIPMIGIKACERYLYNIGELPAPDLGSPFDLISGALVVAFWCFALWPGTNGQNRFGPDPRRFRAKLA
jgi:uncharacterized membrane protein YhaH (DUF805 family)